MTPEEARSALADVGEARSRLAAAYDYPFSRHLAFGALVGALVAVQAFGSTTATVAAPLVIFGVLAIQRWDRARTGTFVNGLRRGRTLPVTLALLAVMLALVLPAMYYSRHGAPWVALVLGAVAVPVSIAFSYAWQRAYLRELGEDSK